MKIKRYDEWNGTIVEAEDGTYLKYEDVIEHIKDIYKNRIEVRKYCIERLEGEITHQENLNNLELSLKILKENKKI